MRWDEDHCREWHIKKFGFFEDSPAQAEKKRKAAARRDRRRKKREEDAAARAEKN